MADVSELSRATELAGYLAELAGRRWQWGVTDCLLIGADWLVRIHGVDPAAGLRGTYHDSATCDAVLARHGGLERLVSGSLARFGIPRTNHPEPGDLALVRAPVADRGRIRQGHVGALVVGPGRAAVMTPDLGLVIAPLPIWRAWAV